jgi:hypothetical protein
MKGNRFGWVAVLFFGSGIPLFIWQIVASRRSPVAVERRAVALAPGGAGLTQAGGEAATFTADVDETDAATTEAARDTVKFLRASESQIRHKVAAAMVELHRSGTTATPSAPMSWRDGSLSIVLRFGMKAGRLVLHGGRPVRRAPDLLPC